MRRTGKLMPRICEIDNFLSAYYKARRGKQNKASVRLFSRNLFENISILRDSFVSGEFRFGKYHYFTIHDPKCRTICAASFPERIVHHALINVCKPYFERNLIYDTYATREGKGIYAALDKALKAMAKYGYVAKMDVRKYFDSISHSCLTSRLDRMFKEPELLHVFQSIIDSYQTAPGRGIPIGNLTSQYFANQYLSGLDHYVKEVLRVPVYLRYMDDMLVFGNSREEVKAFVAHIQTYVETRLELELKPAVLASTFNGVSFLGYHVSRHKILLNRRSKLRFKRKLRYYAGRFGSGALSEKEYQGHLLPLLAYVKKAYTVSLRKRFMENCS